MNETFEIIKNVFFAAGEWISLILEAISVIFIAAGMISSLILILKTAGKSRNFIYTKVRIKLGGWLSVALEFQLASDIVKTTVNPTYENLLITGIIAVIRTFLNYFLNRELKEEMELSNALNKSETKE